LQKVSHKQFVGVKMARTGIISELIDDCRYAAVEMYDTIVRDTTFKDCKFSSVNWRTSSFKRVVFENCIFDKVDFAGSEFFSTSFIDCTWKDISISNCSVGSKRLVLTGTKFVAVAGVESLARHELEYEQAIALLPQLLSKHQITIA